ncbi:MAG: AMP-binding protein [Polyangiaceae bacterium]
MPTLLQALERSADSHPERVAFRFLRDGEFETEAIEFGCLRERAQQLAALLVERCQPGERALLVYPQGVEFIVAFIACLYARITAVPVSVPNRRRGMQSLERIAGDCQASLLLSSTSFLEQSAPERQASVRLAALPSLDTSQETAALASLERAVEEHDVALLQYTSGSTAAPRGVLVTHANLADNQQQIAQSLGGSSDSVYVSWLPMFHDMGLGIALQAIWLGASCVLLSPHAFFQRPHAWLQAISRYRGSISGGPDFAFQLCTRHATPAQVAELDLSSWRVAFNGSEPVRLSTLEQFAEVFEPCGFRRGAFHPVYGLAEATVLAASEPPGQGPRLRRFANDALERGRAEEPSTGAVGRELVSYGGAWGSGEIIIVDPETRAELAQGSVGELWLAGGSVARGYWNDDAETARAFGAYTAEGRGPFLRSGDLGFSFEQRLFVLARLRDVLRLGLRSCSPQDIEDTASLAHPALSPYAAAAFTHEVDAAQRLVIVLEVARSALRTLDAEEATRAVRVKLLRKHGLVPDAVVLLKPSTLPRTTSGKVRRGACHAAYVESSLLSVHAWQRSLEPPATSPRPRLGPTELSRARADNLVNWIASHASLGPQAPDEEWLQSSIARQGLLGLQVEPQQGGLGLGHSDAARVLAALSDVNFELGLCVGLSHYLTIEPVMRHAKSELRDLLLPGLSHGREHAGFALLDLAAAPANEGVALAADAAGAFRLFGSKYVESVGQKPSVYLVFACEARSSGISAFVVFEGSEGLSLRQRERGTQRLGFRRDTLLLDGVSVTRSHLLGESGQGLAIAHEATQRARFAILACCIGGLRRCATLARELAPFSEAVNGAPTPNPVTLARLGSIRARLVALECLLNRVASALDDGVDAGAASFAACRILGPELLSHSVDDLLKLGFWAESGDLLNLLYRESARLKGFDGAPESIAERAGAVAWEDPAELTQLLKSVFGAADAEALVERVFGAVSQRRAKLGGALGRRSERWAHTRIGELGAWMLLLCAVESAQRDNPTRAQRDALIWVRAELDHALAAIRFGTPSEMIALDTSDSITPAGEYFEAPETPRPSLEEERVAVRP